MLGFQSVRVLSRSSSLFHFCHMLKHIDCLVDLAISLICYGKHILGCQPKVVVLCVLEFGPSIVFIFR